MLIRVISIHSLELPKLVTDITQIRDCTHKSDRLWSQRFMSSLIHGFKWHSMWIQRVTDKWRTDAWTKERKITEILDQCVLEFKDSHCYPQAKHKSVSLFCYPCGFAVVLKTKYSRIKFKDSQKQNGYFLKMEKNVGFITHRFSNVSIKLAEWGSASTNKSIGNSVATLCSTPGPSRDKMAAASRNCLPSANRSTRLSARRGEVYVFFSLSRSRRIRSRLSFMFDA